MPELPEVETVRAGLADHVLGRRIAAVEVSRDRAVRHQEGGAAELAALLVDRTPTAAVRRGKFLWLTLDGPDGAPEDHALLAHLGMSGQLLVTGPGDPALPETGRNPHLRVRIGFADATELHFVDQRTFGHLTVVPLVPTPDGGPGGFAGTSPDRAYLPAPVAHIARDLLDPLLAAPGAPARVALNRRIRAGSRGIKRVLLDQEVVSGVGNIYADEALWRARLHYARPTDRLRARQVADLLDAATEVMSEALVAGGTSFDALYVNVNGASGYFDRSLNVYGQEGEPCPRCGTPIVREAFMNRSSYFCPSCQRPPRGI
ncbi:bifunctional DNA-formamidopyrimidine glycosylase/DNA-(apurinic or apyrimidinic site) lyase [Occultella glacieicola]|uniref:Bifunctional DNA-formamidopyrimidine glycosylase/DNA-(Apurinic or apyrimidinic site) lyase n=1 Tax=Occultella glacieicola TaxID=2518684 RepID=A0ABY2EA60_9MICO|nr:bifunctional DNA-formamidopyrimidine glycosylase/DNA-(apurinic or apyrimidinic site) lyase [Occultella glacieicola]TDE95755.1 bifunctional DNA-formamidopyrimidine glycosylase/DNA-(apurinic or apyrimidinic site) lyase [Occultella glacieicola]